MSIHVDEISWLASLEGTRLLERLTAEDLSENNTLRLITQLRKEFSAEQARSALEMARLRLKAVDKFCEQAQQMFFTRAALEQASDPLIRAYRAGQIRATYGSQSTALNLIDACCGVGSDSLAFAQAGMQVLGLDLEPVNIALAQHNARVLGVPARFETEDVRGTLPNADVVFFDPARRDEQGNRIYDVERYQPPLSTLRFWNKSQVVAKLSPGVELTQLEAYGGKVEFISVKGDLKEAVLWLGADSRNKATLLTESAVYCWEVADQPVQVAVRAPRGWLVEPDPAILRAGLVQDVAAACEGTLLDETIAYFTTDNRPDSPWVRSWQIIDWMPFNVKKLRAYLRERDIGEVTVKKRGSAVTPEALLAQLKLKGTQACVVVLTRFQRKPIMLVCKPYESNQG